MSSLRINHQSRTIGETKPGDTSRVETPVDGVSFALKLGAAGLGATGDIPAQTGAVSDGATPSAHGKRGEARGKPDAAAAVLVLEGSLGTSAADLSGSTVATNGTAGAQTGTAADAATVTSMSLPAATARDIGLSNPPSDTAGGDTTGRPPPNLATVVRPGTGTTPYPTPTARDLSAPSPPSNAVSVSPNLGQSEVPPGLGLIGFSPELGPIGPPSNPGQSDVSPDFGRIGTSSNLGLTGTSLTATSPSPRPGAIQALPSLLGALSGIVPPVPGGGAGTSSFAGESSDGRGRFTPLVGTPEAVGAGVALGGTGEATAFSAASTAAPTTNSDPTAVVAGPDQVPDQVAGQLVRMVSSGPREIVMRLHPPELGDLTLQVAVSGRDVTAWFETPQPQVQTAISQAIGQLQTDLGNAGYNLNGAWVGSNAAGSGQPQRRNSSPPPGPAHVAVPDTSALSGGAAAPASGMSIYV
jgi:hypothetical protein